MVSPHAEAWFGEMEEKEGERKRRQGGLVELES